ncbi:MAG: hypothetical protein OEM67_07820 [Thermoleophilia bacterium]|nr:hypothetical protein [Thermoleophilia bacterium]MDH3725560.1 hypothetical protein [Thermoleophilia bacterium]
MPWRIKLLLVGVVLGLLWGVILWFVGSLSNGEFELYPLVLTLFAAGAIGGGVAAIFGTFTAREKGEKIFAKSPYRRYKRRG